MNAAPSQSPAAEVERIEVEPVNAAARRPLYAKRTKIFPRAVAGRYRAGKWAVLAATLGVYYLLPWIRWDRGPNAPDQAVLIDFPGQRFYFFFIEIWPQEVYYVTGLLILAALALFLVTSIAGRVWCGYACPQTVWTDLFLWVERRVDGDRNARMRLDRARWTGRKLVRRAAKHGIWLLIAVATGVPGCSISQTRRPSPPTSPGSMRRRCPTCSSGYSPAPPICWPAMRANRFAPTCARGRASRARCSTSTPCW